MPYKKMLIFVAILAVFVVSNVQAEEKQPMGHKSAVVLAMFGTTVEPALKGILNIRDTAVKFYPNTEIQIAFTSNIIRKIWQDRAHDPVYAGEHPQVPAEILHIQGPLATIANLQDKGYDQIIVQPTHIALGEEFLDLSAYIKALASIETIKEKFKPFHTLVIGRPVFGTFGKKHPYSKDIITVARSLADDVKIAADNGAALLYMGHGNDYFPSGGSYLQFEKEMRILYPEVRTFIGTVEGFPSFEDVLARLQKENISRVVIKPFMTVAGDHAMNDMAGPEPDSWQTMLVKEGVTVIPVLRGLGEQEKFARIIVDHLSDAATDSGVILR